MPTSDTEVCSLRTSRRGEEETEAQIPPTESHLRRRCALACVDGVGQSHCTSRYSRRKSDLMAAARTDTGFRAVSFGAGGLPRPGSSKPRAKSRGIRAECRRSWSQQPGERFVPPPTRRRRFEQFQGLEKGIDRNQKGNRSGLEARVSIALGIRSVSLDVGSWVDSGRATSSRPHKALSLVGGLGRLPPLRVRASRSAFRSHAKVRRRHSRNDSARSDVTSQYPPPIVQSDFWPAGPAGCRRLEQDVVPQ